MVDLKMNPNLQLSRTSFCLICKELFSLGEHIPIKMHQKNKHEICYKCLVSNNIQCCPIDKIPYHEQSILLE